MNVDREKIERLAKLLAPNTDRERPAADQYLYWLCDMLPEIVVALERADEVADQGCEFCEAMVTDRGPEDEAHGHWWGCGECWNKSAVEAGTIIAHLSDLLDNALKHLAIVEQSHAEILEELRDCEAECTDLRGALRERG